MKKILGLIGALGLTASSVATGIAATPVQTQAKRQVKEYSDGSWVSGDIYGVDWRMYISAETSRKLWAWQNINTATWKIRSLRDWRGQDFSYVDSNNLAYELLYANKWFKFDWGAKNGGLWMKFYGRKMVDWG